jgi:hypothetical protein
MGKTTQPATPGQGSPPDPGAITGLFTGLTFIAAIIGAMKLAKGPIPRPGAPAAAIREYYHHSAPAVRFSVAGQAISILSLARFTGTVARLAARAAPQSRLLPATAVISGAASVASLAISAATHAALTIPRDRDDETMIKLARRMFIAGGPVHGVAYGIFTAVLATAARRTGLFGRAAAATGLISAATGTLSLLYFRWENAGWLIPIGRFSGYLLAGMAGVRLAGSRPPRPALTTPGAPRRKHA